MLIEMDTDIILRHRSNDVVSGLLHLVGVGLSVAVLVVLIVVGARYGSPWHVVSYTLYGSGLILLYIASAAYHLIPNSFIRLKPFMRRFDHAMIYVLIAATYTPVLFIVLSGAIRWILFGFIWFLAFLGAMYKLFGLSFPRGWETGLYLFMGWFIIIATPFLIHTMDALSLSLLVAGGVAYTIGVLFLVLERRVLQRKYFWMHEMFHIFVLFGSALHTIMMFFIL